MLPPFDEIAANFELLEDPTEQFEYLIELGRMLPPMPADAHTEDRLVPGCQSKVWLDMQIHGRGPPAIIDLVADSDAQITKGLVAFLVALYSGKTAAKIADTDAVAMLRDMGLGQHVTSKRSNGLRSMVERIRGAAQQAAAAAA